MEGADFGPGSNSRRGSSVLRRLWALCPCLLPSPPTPTPPCPRCSGAAVVSAEFRSSAPQTRRSALICPSVTCPTLGQMRGCGQQPDPGCFHASVLYPRFRMHAHPTLQASPTTPATAAVSDPSRLTVGPQSAPHARPAAALRSVARRPCLSLRR